jgi:hypothetical protein
MNGGSFWGPLLLNAQLLNALAYIIACFSVRSEYVAPSHAPPVIDGGRRVSPTLLASASLA